MGELVVRRQQLSGSLVFLVSLDDLLTRRYARVVGREEFLGWTLACVVVCVSDVPKPSTCYLSLFY